MVKLTDVLRFFKVPFMYILMFAFLIALIIVIDKYVIKASIKHKPSTELNESKKISIEVVSDTIINNTKYTIFRTTQYNGLITGTFITNGTDIEKF